VGIGDEVREEERAVRPDLVVVEGQRHDGGRRVGLLPLANEARRHGPTTGVARARRRERGEGPRTATAATGAAHADGAVAQRAVGAALEASCRRHRRHVGPVLQDERADAHVRQGVVVEQQLRGRARGCDVPERLQRVLEVGVIDAHAAQVDLQQDRRRRLAAAVGRQQQARGHHGLAERAHRQEFHVLGRLLVVLDLAEHPADEAHHVAAAAATVVPCGGPMPQHIAPGPVQHPLQVPRVVQRRRRHEAEPRLEGRGAHPRVEPPPQRGP